MQTPLMATRAGRPEHAPESEMVIVDVRDPEIVVLKLDDGEEITFDRVELCAALGNPQDDAARLEAA